MNGYDLKENQTFACLVILNKYSAHLSPLGKEKKMVMIFKQIIFKIHQ